MSTEKHPCVIRVIKHTTDGSLSASGKHNWREKEVSNADSKRTHLNTDLRKVRGSKALVEAVNALVGTSEEKTKRRRVKCLEYLITAHHTAFKSHGGSVDDEAFVNDSVEFLEKLHGKDNLVAVNIQRDELATHVVAYAVPFVQEPDKLVKRSVIVGKGPDGKALREVRMVPKKAMKKLSAAHFIDGPAKLAKLHTDFANEVGKKHGLVRGIHKTYASHTEISRWYSAIAKPLGKLKITSEILVPQQKANGQTESLDQVAQRLTDAVNEAFEHVLLAAQTANLDREKARAAERKVRDMQRDYQELFDAFDPLSQSDRRKMIEMMQNLRLERLAEADPDAFEAAQNMHLAMQNMVASGECESLEMAQERVNGFVESGSYDEIQKWAQWMPKAAHTEELEWAREPSEWTPEQSKGVEGGYTQ